MALIDDLITRVKDDSGRLTDPDDYEAAITAALSRYSKHRPQEVTYDVLGAGFHDVELPEAWEEDFSEVRRVEFPVNEVPAVLIESDRWEIYQSLDGSKLRLLDETPENDESVRVTITIPRAEETIIAADHEAVVSLAASFCCEWLANLFAQSMDPTIAADAVNYRSKADGFTKRAKRLADIYHQHMGVDPEGSAPAAFVMAGPPPQTRWRLTH